MASESVMTVQSRAKGIVLVLIGATLWGISGTVAQYLFQKKDFSPEWLVSVRLLLSGFILLLFSFAKGDKQMWEVWKSNTYRWSLLLFGIIGMLGVQYTYFAAIKSGNAATATLLQYLGPVFITCYIAFRSKRLPTLYEFIAIILALAGTFFLVTNGDVQTLSISKWALFWGIASAVALAFYTLQPYKLLDRWGSTLIVGWGMLVGGIGFSFLYPPWNFRGQWSYPSILAVLFVVLFGTLIAFYCYLESLKYIQAAEASLLACAEPLSAAFLSVIWLHVPFGVIEWLGAACIIATIVILSLKKREKLHDI
ncbi:DMT family transporter [Aneurinibacillus tyrosinisolvens]|uniref:DMT family transporter n=1 Tax=Aneurinibacillus tyrosinisolvens TaxID=1443435 RepID=UPI000A470756|nr:EamA family transporter [Aneurinibacillus tyrosinisolvens]